MTQYTPHVLHTPVKSPTIHHRARTQSTRYRTPRCCARGSPDAGTSLASLRQPSRVTFSPCARSHNSNNNNNKNNNKEIIMIMIVIVSSNTYNSNSNSNSNSNTSQRGARGGEEARRDGGDSAPRVPGTRTPARRSFGTCSAEIRLQPFRSAKVAGARN